MQHTDGITTRVKSFLKVGPESKYPVIPGTQQTLKNTYWMNEWTNKQMQKEEMASWWKTS